MATPRLTCVLLLTYVATALGPGVLQRIQRASAAESGEVGEVGEVASSRGGIRQRIQSLTSEPSAEPTEFRADLKRHWAKGKFFSGLGPAPWGSKGGQWNWKKQKPLEGLPKGFSKAH